MYVKVTEINKDKTQLLSTLDNFVKVIPHIML